MFIFKLRLFLNKSTTKLMIDLNRTYNRFRAHMDPSETMIPREIVYTVTCGYTLIKLKKKKDPLPPK